MNCCCAKGDDSEVVVAISDEPDPAAVNPLSAKGWNSGKVKSDESREEASKSSTSKIGITFAEEPAHAEKPASTDERGIAEEPAPVKATPPVEPVPVKASVKTVKIVEEELLPTKIEESERENEPEEAYTAIKEPVVVDFHGSASPPTASSGSKQQTDIQKLMDSMAEDIDKLGS
mmetsp:Transcript_30134/g.54789  ORF Transcript_30134/g.54789 Transcript_30134/m.54789 type:complete len:175 (+) Transcript_30134:69-593(+)